MRGTSVCFSSQTAAFPMYRRATSRMMHWHIMITLADMIRVKVECFASSFCVHATVTRCVRASLSRRKGARWVVGRPGELKGEGVAQAYPRRMQ